MSEDAPTDDAGGAPQRALLHPLAGSNYRNFKNLCALGQPLSFASRWQRRLSTIGLWEQWPLAKWEEFRWRKKVDHHQWSEPPVFVIGHWGSGTTYLHNLLSLDPNFGFLDFGDALMPWNMLGASRYWRFYIRRLIPKDRRFDRVRLSLESPQEEEIALANMNSISIFHSFYFPRQIQEYTDRSLFLEKAGEAERMHFEECYQLLARKLSFKRNGRRLLFKNPASTTRIPMLRRLFPGAKFIHLVRNPYEVYASGLNRLPHLLGEFAWQDYDDLNVHAHTLDTYEAVMRRYLRDRSALGDGELFEARYESLVEDPAGLIRKAYSALDLPISDSGVQALEELVANAPPYVRKPRTLTPEEVHSVKERWRFSFEEWDYSTAADYGGIKVGERT